MNDDKVVESLKQILLDFGIDGTDAKELWEELKVLDDKPRKKKPRQPNRYKELQAQLEKKGVYCSISDLKRAYGNPQEKRSQIKKDLQKL